MQDPERAITEAEAALADPELQARLQEHLAREKRDEHDQGYTTEELLRHLHERGLRLYEDETIP